MYNDVYRRKKNILNAMVIVWTKQRFLENLYTFLKGKKKDRHNHLLLIIIISLDRTFWRNMCAYIIN